MSKEDYKRIHATEVPEDQRHSSHCYALFARLLRESQTEIRRRPSEWRKPVVSNLSDFKKYRPD